MAKIHDITGLRAVHALVEAGVEIRSVVHDSRDVSAGSMYACLRGEHFDGHAFADDAVRAGATAVLADHELDLSAVVGAEIPQIVVDDTRVRLGPIAAEIAGRPSRALATVGITGTNGKTTTAALLASIFEAAGQPCGVVGTLQGERTTPEAPELQSVLREFVDTGRTAAVLEVSSHALAMHRVDGTEFDAVVFTNLGHDHLDLHGSQEEYFRAKARLFTPSFARLGVVNIDDTYGRLLADTVQSTGSDGEFRVVTFGLTEVSDVEVTAATHRYTWRGRQVEVPLGGDFNVANSLAALTTAVELGIDPDVAVTGVATLATVPGRFEVIATDESRRRGITVVVDYAHTPDGLARVLDAARSVVSGDGSLTVVFGCGGNRDRGKRPEMGAVASRGADRVVITSDNPRGESPQMILDEILGGIERGSHSEVVVLIDRREAIAEAVASAGRGDVVVIAGKGHETTQEFDDRTVEFDDRAVARELLETTS